MVARTTVEKRTCAMLGKGRHEAPGCELPPMCPVSSWKTAMFRKESADRDPFFWPVRLNHEMAAD